MEKTSAVKKLRLETVPPIVPGIYDGRLTTEKENLESMNDQEAKCKFTLNPLRNPMEINTIIRNLFGYFRVEDLKSCRAVCHKWNAEAERLLRKNAKITFGPLKNSDMVRRPENFLETFRHFSASTTNLPFTSFSFLNKVKWRVSDFENFIDQHRNDILELKLYEIGIINEHDEWEKELDINYWFSNLFIPKLTISSFSVGWTKKVTKFTFSSKILALTTHINLGQCNIKIEHEKPLCPIFFDISGLNFYKDGILLKEYCLHDSIDFSKARRIKIARGEDELFTVPILDFSKCIGLSVQYMELINVEVRNWDVAKAVIETLVLNCTPLLHKTKIEIKELHFKSSVIDLSALPLSIEKIHFPFCLEIDICCSETITLPNLKCLELMPPETLECLSYFKNCSNLRDIDIDSPAGTENVSLNVEWLPNSVTQMKVKGVENIEGELDEKRKLVRLVLELYSLGDAGKVLNKITPNILVLQWKSEFETRGSLFLFLQKFKELVLYIGPFIWDDKVNVFELSPMKPLVDNKAKYYVFENGQGRSIKPKEFEDMKVLDKNEHF